MKEVRNVRGQADQDPSLKIEVEEIEEILALVLNQAMIRNHGNVGREKEQGNDKYLMLTKNMSPSKGLTICFVDYSNHN